MHYYRINKDACRWIREEENARRQELAQMMGAFLMIAISFMVMLCAGR